VDAHRVTHPADRSKPGPEVERAVLDRSGTLVSVNEAWERFARENGGDPSRTGVGVSFLAVCDAATDDPVARVAASAVRAALTGDLPAPLSMVIPCHAPDDERWFDLLVTPCFDEDRGPDGATLELSQRGAPAGGPPDGAAAGKTSSEVVVREHLRISGELHTSVVDRLFSLAMDVYGLAAAVEDGRTRGRLLTVVESIDDVIVALRRSVFDVTQAALPEMALRSRLSQALDHAAAGTDLETTLTVHGGAGRGLSDRQAVDVVAVVREGLAQAVRRAATAVAVRVDLRADDLLVEVSHDGSEQAAARAGRLPAGRWSRQWRETTTAEDGGRRTHLVVRLATAGSAATG
jgi:hypothetical protein